ncbi:hypothetical protein L596_024911 [Steinernema carpocapsae]|uniref:Uncharacterized protein n=1 Tax=Steinernema carpocapsae TaxID=34508 RepID=A0A4U5M723_STECR|nr:hypothetical protein L596_024911 [Steinernema carpocapsae]
MVPQKQLTKAAPEEVLAFLYSKSNINAIPIGSNALNANLEDVAGEIGNEHPLLFTHYYRVIQFRSYLRMFI